MQCRIYAEDPVTFLAAPGHVEHVTEPGQIGPALERAYASGKPACVNVELEQDQSYSGGGYV